MKASDFAIGTKVSIDNGDIPKPKGTVIGNAPTTQAGILCLEVPCVEKLCFDASCPEQHRVACNGEEPTCQTCCNRLD